MKNIHNGRGNINVTGSGGGNDLLVVAAIIAGGYFLLTMIVHLLIMLAIALGAIVLSAAGGIAIWHFYIAPRITKQVPRYDRDQRAIAGEIVEHPAIENNRIIVMTEDQYDNFIRRYRDEG